MEKERQFYSQRGEDRWIFENLDLPANGAFVDIGCNDPINNNNTYAFEKYLGWKGVGVDINFAHASEWVKERPGSLFIAGAALPDEISARLIEVVADERNNGELIRAKTAATNSVLCAAFPVMSAINLAHDSAIIDLLSIDVEGMETALLTTILKYNKPRIIIAEYNTLGLPKQKTILPLCRKHGYKLVHTTEFNFILTL